MVKVKSLIITVLLFISLGIHAQSKEQVTSLFQQLLELFCKEQYDSCFNGKQYIDGSLTVTTLESDEAKNVIKVKGKHSYKGQYIPFFGRKTHSNVDFKAEVSVADSGIKIRFWKWMEPDIHIHWEGPCEKTMILTDHKK